MQSSVSTSRLLFLKSDNTRSRGKVRNVGVGTGPEKSLSFKQSTREKIGQLASFKGLDERQHGEGA